MLVVGATGQLGGAVARKLLAAGIPVRAFGRTAAKLDDLKSAGAEIVAGDLLDRDAVSRACEGAGQIFTSANNVMGHGPSSPNRVDIPAHQNLCAAARQHGVRRIVYTSARGLGGDDSPVDYFRVKHRIEEIVRQSGVPYVLLRPAAFMEIWVGMLLGDGIAKNGVAMLFGDGQRVSNFIAVEDVAEFALRILEREEIRDEAIEVGGPSNISFADIVPLVERELGVTAKRRHIPVPVLRAAGALLRPFSEVLSRRMSLGYFTATRDASFDKWRVSAQRFGVSPMSVDAFVAKRFAGARSASVSPDQKQ